MLFAVTSVQADYQSGLEALQAGDYETVYKELIYEAEKGNSHDQYYMGNLLLYGLFSHRR